MDKIKRELKMVLIKLRLVEKFGEEILRNSLVWYENDERDLRDLLKDLDLRNVLEVGTMFGLSAAVLSEYCYHVYTFDIDNHPEKDEVWRFLNRFNISFNSKSKIKYDLAFVDGEHWHGECEKDFNRCKDIPLILFHDYNETHKEVKSFVDSLKGKKIKKGNFCLYYND